MKNTVAIIENIELSSDDDLQGGYQDAASWLENELHLLDLKILRHLNLHERFGDADATTSGFFISDGEVRSLLKASGLSQGKNPTPEQDDYLNAKIKQLEDYLSKKSSGKETSTILPIEIIKEKFGLNRFETQVLVMALALEINQKYERIYAYFNDDLNKKAPSIDLALGALDASDEKFISGCIYFSEQAPLRAYKLISIVNNHDEESFLSMRFKVDEGIKNLLLGIDTIHPRLKSIIKIEYPDEMNELSGSKAKAKHEIRNVLSNTYKYEPKGLVFWLYGKACIEKRTTVKALCDELEIPLIIIDLEDILSDHNPAVTVNLLFRDAVLNSAALYFIGGDLLLRDDEKARSIKRLFLKVITAFAWFVFVDANNFWAPEGYDEFFNWCPIEFNSPHFYERRNVWASLLQQRDIDPADIDALASRFAFDENQIAKAFDYVNLKNNGSQINFDSLLHACSRQSPKSLPYFTKKVIPHYKWDDLVLPEDKLQYLKEICGFLEYKHQVYFNWGFDKKLSLGRGLNVLFTGPSGTGKTMTAEILATELKLDLYKTDLSSIVSKYIGETEKNLEKIFEATSSGNTILFFDEADALFGKRSEVKDAHDRFANIETNYLLQRIEEHEGVVILSTNLSKNMDNAFLRRMQFIVEFPFPNEKYREIIWKKIFPKATPVSPDTDYRFLAKKLDLSGGNIKNIALASAFLAAEESSCIEMKHIIFAAKRECQKIGKAFVKSDFGSYSELFEMEKVND